MVKTISINLEVWTRCQIQLSFVWISCDPLTNIKNKLIHFCHPHLGRNRMTETFFDLVSHLYSKYEGSNQLISLHTGKKKKKIVQSKFILTFLVIFQHNISFTGMLFLIFFFIILNISSNQIVGFYIMLFFDHHLLKEIINYTLRSAVCI